MAPPNKFPTRRLGKNGPEVSALGFGLMGLSVGYGPTGSDEERLAILDRAWELGETFWDTADAYGDSEELVGKWFELHPERRQDIFLATKFGLRMHLDAPGKMSLALDSTPEYCRQACEKSLQRLGVESIDLYYIHRLDEKTPIEKTIEAMVQLKKEGKIKHMGISECSSASLRRAHAIHPIAAVQVEYTPWDTDIETEEGTNLLAACRELGVAVVCYSPLGRGIMTGRFRSADDFAPDDYRRILDRYNAENFPKNLALVDEFAEIGRRKGCTSGQLALAWLMAQGEDIIPIPGTKRIKYLEENLGAVKIQVTGEEEKSLRRLVDTAAVKGRRAPKGMSSEYANTPPL